MDQTFICRKFPCNQEQQLKMLIFQKLEDGTDVAVGYADYSYDGDDCIETQITYGGGKITYRDISVPLRRKRNIFYRETTHGRYDIATEYQFYSQNGVYQHFLQWSTDLFQVICQENQAAGPGTITVYARESRDQEELYQMQPLFQVRPEIQGDALSWQVQISEEYPAEISLIFATLPLTLDREAYISLL